MHREFATAIRGIRSSGQTVQLLGMLVEDLPSQDLEGLFRLVQFHAERNRAVYGDHSKKVAIKWLSDETIKEKVSKAWMSRRRSARVNGQGVERRELADLLLEEAEYRGIKTDEQLFWERVVAQTADGRAAHIPKMGLWIPTCTMRGGHTFMLIADRYICTDCREKVDRERIDSVVDDRRHEWLRKLTS